MSKRTLAKVSLARRSTGQRRDCGNLEETGRSSGRACVAETLNEDQGSGRRRGHEHADRIKEQRCPLGHLARLTVLIELAFETNLKRLQGIFRENLCRLLV